MHDDFLADLGHLIKDRQRMEKHGLALEFEELLRQLSTRPCPLPTSQEDQIQDLYAHAPEKAI
jgi:hypothetical protein